MLDYLTFQKQRIKRTRQDIVAFARQYVWPSVLALVASLAVIPAVQFAGADVTEQATLLVLDGLLGPVVLITVMALFFYVRTPAEIHKEMQAQIDLLHSHSLQKRENQFIANGLAVIRETGDIILRKRITEEEFEDWNRQRTNWEAQALIFVARHMSYQDAVDLRHIQTFGKVQYVYKISDEHNRALNHLTVSLDKIQKMLDHYREYWGPMTTVERSGIAAKIFPEVTPCGGSPSPENEDLDLRSHDQSISSN